MSLEVCAYDRQRLERCEFESSLWYDEAQRLIHRQNAWHRKNGYPKRYIKNQMSRNLKYQKGIQTA
jgi:hypothetical protein